VSEVLGYVQYDKRHLVQCMRQANEDALRRGLLTLEESALLMRRFEEGMAGYTYLEEEPRPALGTLQIANGANGLTMQARDCDAAPARRRGAGAAATAGQSTGTAGAGAADPPTGARLARPHGAQQRNGAAANGHRPAFFFTPSKPRMPATRRHRTVTARACA
jgi:hypothetical protein